MNFQQTNQRFLFLCDRFKIYPEHESIGLLLLNHMRLRLTYYLPEALTYLLLTRYHYERDLSFFAYREHRSALKCVKRHIECASLPRPIIQLTDKDRFKLVRDNGWAEDMKTEEYFMQVNSLLTLVSDSGYGRNPPVLKGAACYLVGKSMKARFLSQTQLKNVFNVRAETTVRNAARVIDKIRRECYG